MAKKKETKKAATKKAPACSPENCNCTGILALIIIALTWWKPAITWSQITITVAAALVLLSEKSRFCKK